MAGDWIKMRGNLWDDPRVVRICDLTDSTEGPVIGALYWLWATADQHTEDGFMPGLTVRQIDRKTGLPGFGDALVEIGWLIVKTDGVVIVNFSEHNGASAKRRCSDAQRKANVRSMSASDADNERKDAGCADDKTGQAAELEKEKRREEKNTTPDGVVKPRKRATTVPDRPEDVPEAVWTDFVGLRRAKSAPLTATALAGIRREADAAGLPLSEALAMCCARGWQGFRAAWTQQPPRASPAVPEWQQRRDIESRTAALLTGRATPGATAPLIDFIDLEPVNGKH